MSEVGSRELKEALAASLRGQGIEYLHEPELGGRRKPRADSRNAAWREEGFRGYADYLAVPSPPAGPPEGAEKAAFQAAVGRLAGLAGARTTAILCAEAVPWRCHRQLIADSLTARGVEVRHILGKGTARRHLLHPTARLEPDGSLRYPASGAASSPP